MGDQPPTQSALRSLRVVVVVDDRKYLETSFPVEGKDYRGQRSATFLIASSSSSALFSIDHFVTAKSETVAV